MPGVAAVAAGSHQVEIKFQFWPVGTATGAFAVSEHTAPNDVVWEVSARDRGEMKCCRGFALDYLPKLQVHSIFQIKSLVCLHKELG